MKRLHPLPLWNQTERPSNHLPDVCVVLDEKKAVSQTGTLYLVEKVNGERVWLDAGWFHVSEVKPLHA